MSDVSSQRELFLRLSGYLTGFLPLELRGTGMLDEFFCCVSTAVNPIHFRRLLSLTEHLIQLVHASQASLVIDDEIRRSIMEDETLSPIAQNIIKLWYRGDWPDSHAQFGSAYISAQAYQEALIWKTIGAHPPGAKQPGFGSWSRPPVPRSVPASDPPGEES